LFDHATDGFAELTGWVAPDDGILARDLNANGTIDSGRELFGSETLLSSGQKAANGFEALRELDSNGDGVINANDTAFAELRVWQDSDGDGFTSEGELLTVDEAGIKSINLQYNHRAPEQHWQHLLQALNRLDAERKGTPPWQGKGQGADTSALAGLLTGNAALLRVPGDAVGLVASGTALKGFAGLHEGVPALHG